MFNFKLLAGWHVVNGKKKKAGDIFESEINLAKCFPGRFEESKEVIEQDVINIAPNKENEVIQETAEKPDSKPAEKKQPKKVKAKRKSKKVK